MNIFPRLIYLILNVLVFLFLASCGKQFQEIHEGNWNLLVGTNLDQAGDLYHAVEYLKLAANEEDGRKDAEIYLEQIKQRKEKAEECIEEAQFKLDTSFLTRYHFRDYFQMGVCHELMDRRDAAMEFYNKSIQLNSKHAITYVYRGLLFEKMGNLANAESDLKLALQKEEGHLSPRFHLGMFYLRNKKYDFVEEQAAALADVRPIYAQILRTELKKYVQK